MQPKLNRRAKPKQNAIQFAMTLVATLLHSAQDPVTAFGTLVALLSSYIFYKTYLYPTFLSPLRHIPGPPNSSKYNKYNLPFLGNFLDILREEAGVPHRAWIDQYGGLVCYRGLFNNQRILLADPKAIHHVFVTNSYKYVKAARTRRLLGQVTGYGVLLAEGDAHKKQRKMINPAFGLGHIKEMVRRFDGQNVDRARRSIQVKGDRTLDIIGQAGFGYDFRSLVNPDSELSQAYRELFEMTSNIVALLRIFLPFYVYIPFEHNRRRWRAIRAIDRVTSHLISEKKSNAISDAFDSEDEKARDLMSILIRGNEQVGSLEDGKLTDQELKDQILTFLAAGHETTSTTVTWMLHVFSTHPEVQKRVRDEMLSEIGRPAEGKTLSYDALNALPYLNACVKELLRFVSPVPTTSRVAAEDDTILGYDIPKGTQVFLSPAALHKLKSVFGEDAEEFKPERWMDPSKMADSQTNTKFVTSDMNWAYVPFLVGPRNCIGSKFALIETKVLLYYILMDLEFEPSPGFKFKKVARVTWRPSPGMKLRVKRVSSST
ncbi:hypothetical protein BGZ70_004998 [Mortierella alpina]|uniref:Cytochrome P450 n=1 Tax=Mortierella alpina TaxID=64518 RepID=A0A9P6J9V7_MORAP|nr:hypothetical protein BGZ70_004998 [Mortierella alpina]